MPSGNVGRFELSCTNAGSIPTSVVRVACALEGALIEPLETLTSSQCDWSGVSAYAHFASRPCTCGSVHGSSSSASSFSSSSGASSSFSSPDLPSIHMSQNLSVRDFKHPAMNVMMIVARATGHTSEKEGKKGQHRGHQNGIHDTFIR